MVNRSQAGESIFLLKAGSRSNAFAVSDTPASVTHVLNSSDAVGGSYDQPTTSQSDTFFLSLGALGSSGDTDTGTDFEVEFERHYLELTQAGSAASAKAYWSVRGELAAKWLVSRMRREHSLERLDAAADVLSTLGWNASEVIAASLEQSGSPEFHGALLRALRWLKLDATQSSLHLESVLSSVIVSSDDQELAILAVAATRCLPPAVRRSLLEACRTVSDPELRDTIDEELRR